MPESLTEPKDLSLEIKKTSKEVASLHLLACHFTLEKVSIVFEQMLPLFLE